jgi:small subunit ribosomal protein S13
MAINFNEMISSPYTITKFLRIFFGLGPVVVSNLCKRYGVAPGMIAKNVLSKKLLKLKTHIDRRIPIGGMVIRIKSDAIRRFIINKSIKGSRLGRGLPVRGQRTRANAQTTKKLKNYFVKKYIENAAK